jgi:hypothetical protein
MGAHQAARRQLARLSPCVGAGFYTKNGSTSPGAFDDLLVTVRERLLAGDRAVVQALRGMGGVGKPQLATEYAHRFAASYDLIWWIDSEQPILIGDQFAALGIALGCATPETGVELANPGSQAAR